MNGRAGFGPKIIGNIVGLENSQIVAAELVYRQPTLKFEIPIQVPVNDKGAYDPDGTEFVNAHAQYHFKINPGNLKAAHANRLAVVQNRLQIAARVVSNPKPGETSTKIRLSDLPDGDILETIMEELDDTINSRLVALVPKDDNGRTIWDYTDISGNPINLTMEILKAEPRLQAAMAAAVDDFLNGSKVSSVEDSRPKRGSGSEESTPPTPKASSTASDMPSSKPKRERNTTEEVTSLPG